MQSDDLLPAARALFRDAFHQDPTTVVAAPGRVNLIGEHTDYNHGFVMPFAIDKKTVIAAKPALTSNTVRIVSHHGDARSIQTFDADSNLKPANNWTDYVRGVIAQYLKDLPEGTCGFDAAVVSNVPLGGGLSSSASLEVAMATVIETMFHLSIPFKEKARRCQMCEHEYCNTPCGIMDQFIAACGYDGHALLIDCRPPHTTEHVPLNNPRVAVVVANSNVKHKLSGSEYPDRVRQCNEAAKAMGVSHLRDATLEMLASISLPKITEMRARHVIEEDQRVLQAKEALRAGDYTHVGKLMRASHDSLRDKYEVSTPELDALVEIAMSVDGVYGARMTGGGFGGCTVTLVKSSAVPALLSAIETEYPKRAKGKHASCFVTHPSSGAQVLQHSDGAMQDATSLAGGAAFQVQNLNLKSFVIGVMTGASIAIAMSRYRR